MAQHWAVETRDLTRVFREKRRRFRRRGNPKTVTALDEVNLTVAEGELFGLLGPNGAGKTTLIKILTTLLLPTSGRAFVDGLDVTSDAQAVRTRINMVSGGEHSGYGILTVRETLWMFSQFYGVPNSIAKERIEQLLGVVGLRSDADTKIHKLSSGMRQKLNFTRGFVSDPKIVFLDEPTLGLDVETARHCRQFIRQWVKTRPSKTVLLTTHYMVEADELCDRIAIINHGKILACDSPSNLKRTIQKESVFEAEVSPPKEEIRDIRDLSGVREVSVKERLDDGMAELRLILEEERAISSVLSKVSQIGCEVRLLKKSEPSLEDVFMKLVGRGLEDEDEC